MEESTSHYYPLQSTAIAIIAKVREVSGNFDIVSLTRDIEACQNLLGRERIIDVAILGQFKAGKSSFINSLIMQDVLPVGVIPVTTVLSRKTI